MLYCFKQFDGLNFDDLVGSIKTSKFPPVKIFRYTVLFCIKFDLLLSSITTSVLPACKSQDNVKWQLLLLQNVLKLYCVSLNCNTAVNYVAIIINS